jgi:ABC-2 type transport system ATP-binding protein
MSLLEVSHLRKSYNGTPAVDDLSFRVEAGEIFGLLGPNGAGKTTTMMILAGLRRADSGTVALAGNSFADGGQQLKTILGIVPQDLAIYPDLTARENLSFFGKIYGLDGPTLAERINETLTLIGLTQHANHYVRTFSGGMKRRLNFGAALLHKPRFVILDEPTVGVDPQSRSHLLDCVRQLAGDGVGIIYASHYMEEVEAICERVAIIDHGKLLAEGTLESLLDRSRADVELRVAASAGGLRQPLAGLADVEALTETEARAIVRRRRSDSPTELNERLAKTLEALGRAGIELLAVETREHNLERLFLDLTGRSLRD